MEDAYQRIMVQLQQVHTQGDQAHARFLAAQARGDVNAMRLISDEHQALAKEARALTAELRAVLDAHFAPFRTAADR